MPAKIARSHILVVTAVLAVAALAGCSPSTSAPSAGTGSSAGPSTPAPATPKAKSTAPTLGPLPSNALFRITAIAVQPDGATMDLVQTVFEPSPVDPVDTTLLNNQCNGSGSADWQTLYPASVFYVTTTATAQARAGTPGFNTNADISLAFGTRAAAFSGAFASVQSACAYGRIVEPGTLHGVTAVPSASPAIGVSGWASQDVVYGFDGDGNDPGTPGGDGNTVVKDCAIELSAAATAAAPGIAAWSSQPYDQENGCTYKVP